MRRLRRSPLVLAVLLAVGGCSSDEFREVVSAAGRYKVQMPGTPRERGDDVSEIRWKGQGVEEANGMYVVSYADLPVPADEPLAQVEQRLEGVQDTIVRDLKGTLVKGTAIKLADRYPGREATTESADGKNAVRFRIYLVKNRLYEVMVAGTREFVAGPGTDTFLNSFALTD